MIVLNKEYDLLNDLKKAKDDQELLNLIHSFTELIAKVTRNYSCVELARELYLIISTNQYSPSNINELIKRLEVEIKQ